MKKRGTRASSSRFMNKQILNSKRSARVPSSRFMNKQIANSKRSQLQISFSMIFSIILIIAFVAVAFYAINKFLCIKKTAEISLFKDDFEREINRAFNSEETSNIFKRNMPESVEKVCFADYSSAKGKDKEIYNQLRINTKSNMYFYPLKSCNIPGGFEIKHLDIKNITRQDNPYCIENKGKLEIKIIGYYGNPVKIE